MSEWCDNLSRWGIMDCMEFGNGDNLEALGIEILCGMSSVMDVDIDWVTGSNWDGAWLVVRVWYCRGWEDLKDGALYAESYSEEEKDYDVSVWLANDSESSWSKMYRTWSGGGAGILGA